MRPAMFPIQILGVPFAGLVFDEFGSYDIAFRVFLLFILSRLFLFAFISDLSRRYRNVFEAK